MDIPALSRWDTHIKTLGHGTSGRVDLYQCRGSTMVYAIKKYDPKEKHEDFSDYRTRVSNEHLILSRLNHHNVIRSYKLECSWLRSSVQLYLQYGGNATLKGLIAKKCPPSEMFCFVKQLQQGIRYIHSEGVCHRDLKFANIMITPQGILKIIDFADARLGPRCYGIIGTSSFCAPEVFSSLDYNGYKIDVWAFGIIVYYCIFHRFPWNVAKSECVEFVAFINSCDLNLSRLPAHIQTVLTQCLTVDPTQRPGIDSVDTSSWIAGIDCCTPTNSCKYDHCRWFK
ncbi:hypothetical protein CANTEDRAFT_113569 [Yamadazyma tenuis ATCC 10573]|uniref:Kinase-like protein n=1 Tax=Candida tenuis (strain ATCC 10573 / BCRC 21748 / CBS 615 / JCM 9827 / NBRC 10315 / NRRL Y-1498 / VKM Y-70) TaxID=590646 RepID=G3B0T5_CANTC|nr:kinase-like protein [Yamadazyma tenuis ATCC 10573]XP_006685941.1 uncharacterized protein CANTEDRAFT_113569 [Yamadazyma tenuis ATCC 10573]EGV65134.1 kinase-like protein [Yamadazyma tenuis ATCC 10573]EGV65135.1 hypothetical protein CANTEDRAFT_113569 [Yamadazyma tenuis ATCC 10573]